MNRVAFTLLSERDWTGTGYYHYLLNLLQVLVKYEQERVQPVLFVGMNAAEASIQPFMSIAGLEVVRSKTFGDARKGARLRQALLTGNDRAAARAFRDCRIDVVFENAQFHGWRFPFPTVAWMPDFQHRRLKELFSFAGYWKRDLGFWSQVLSGRVIMLSSEDSRRDCEAIYPQSVGRTSVVRFAVPPGDQSDSASIRAVASEYNLPKDFFYLPNQFWKHKNHRIVIDALYMLKQQGQDLVVAASGKPDDYRDPLHFKTLQSLVKSRKLEDNFRFLGVVPRKHVFALMRACTALINPSLFEGWSTSVEEAKSLGVPMLLSNLRVHVEQVGESGSYFNPQSAAELAALMAHHPRVSDSPRQEMEHVAEVAAWDRVRQFADAFACTVERSKSMYERQGIDARQSPGQSWRSEG